MKEPMVGMSKEEKARREKRIERKCRSWTVEEEGRKRRL
jgi:hypothetical protein